MDAEASWVGLGFSLQPGAINRQMRGLPDEFNGDEVRTKTALNPSVTVGLSSGIGVEVFGRTLGIKSGFGIYQNNYRGMGYTIDNSIDFFAKIAGSRKHRRYWSEVLRSTQKKALMFPPRLSLGGKIGNFGLATAYNSKSGLSHLSVDYNPSVFRKIPETAENKDKHRVSAGLSASATLTMAHPSYTPEISMPMRNTSLSLTLLRREEPGGVFFRIFTERVFTTSSV